MSDWSSGTCPRNAECSFYRSMRVSPLLRIKYATMYPYCKGGRHESCVRWFMMSQGEPVPDDLLPDGGKDLFTVEQRRLEPRPSARVLVVDDMPLFRKSLVTMVSTASDSDVEVREAASAEEALDILNASPNGWALVVSDYNMGQMSGYDLVKEMHTRPSLSGIPVVIFSSESDPDIRTSCSALPRVRWLEKRPNQEPFDEAWRELVVEKKL